MNDPTARAASRNVENAKPAAALVYRGATAERVWLDRATARAVTAMLRITRDGRGDLRGHLNEEAARLLQQTDGTASNEGHHS